MNKKITNENKSQTNLTNFTNFYLLLLFFFSGFAGLCYQVIWVRELSVIFGKTNAAVTVVVSVFMLGLGLGSLCWGKRKIIPQKLTKTFALLQFGIAAGNLILLLVFPFLAHIYRGLVRQFDLSPGWILFFIFCLCAVLMFIPTFLMGGTFPIISQLFIRKETDLGKDIGLLYGSNTVGGILGAASTGYFLVGALGQRETQAIAIIINIIIGALFLKLKTPEPLPAAQKKKENIRPAHGDNIPMQKFFILAAFFSGFAGLAYEILWTRALATFTSNSSYSFSSILVVYLAGVGVGSYIYSKFLSGRRSSMSLLVLLQFGIFISAAVTAFFLNDIPILLNPFAALMKYPVMRVAFPGLFLSLAMMFLPTLLMGIVFPLICRMYTDSIDRLRERIGKIYFYNTMGSMLGPAAAGFVLIPLFGVMKGLLITAMVNVLLALGAALFIEKRASRKKWLLGASAACIVVILLPQFLGKAPYILPPSVFRNPNINHELKYYRETVDGTVVVVEEKQTGVRSCYINNNAVCGVTYDALKVVHYMGHLPLVFNPEAKNALIIGFGIGVTTSAVAQYPLERIDCVEICPGVKKAAPLFAQFNQSIWQDARVNFIAADGRNYLLLTGEKYDIISCDPVHPSLGSGSLYTREYFELCKRQMKPHGVISQYLPLHKMTLAELKILLNTFSTVFPHSLVWLAQTHGVLIGSPGELRLSFAAIEAAVNRINDPFFEDPYLVASGLLLNREGIKNFIGNRAAIHSDNHPILEYFSPQGVHAERQQANITELLRRRQSPAQLIPGIPDAALLEHYIEAQPFYLQGILLHNEGQAAAAFRQFQRALEINPLNREIRLFYDYLEQRMK